MQEMQETEVTQGGNGAGISSSGSGKVESTVITPYACRTNRELYT